MNKVFLIPALMLLIFAGCSHDEITITKEYIINPNWDKQANAIKINKLNLKKDSALTIKKELQQGELLDKLEDDTSFLFVANVKYNGESYSTRKVYFNKDNGFNWWSNRGESKVKEIGNLQKGNWYKFSNLVTYSYYVYIYLDSAGQVHRFKVNLSNY